jgi:hypothetical protein
MDLMIVYFTCSGQREVGEKSKGTSERLEAIVQPFACQKKPMFGHEVYRVNGNMFTGVFQSSIFFRLSLQDWTEFLWKSKDGRQFEPVEGRPMKEYAIVPEKKAKPRKIQK